MKKFDIMGQINSNPVIIGLLLKPSASRENFLELHKDSEASLIFEEAQK